MPPIILTTPDDETVETFEDVTPFLEKDGQPTLQAEALQSFIDDVDFDPIFEHLLSDAELRDLVETREGFVQWDAERKVFVEIDEAAFKKGKKAKKKKGNPSHYDDGGDDEEEDTDEAADVDEAGYDKTGKYHKKNGQYGKDKNGKSKTGKKGAAFLESSDFEDGDVARATIQTIPGDVLAEVVDLDDLEMMLDYVVTHETDHESFSAKVALEALGYDVEKLVKSLEERPFKKGDFKKIHKGGGASRVNRMLGAMMHKQAIQRAATKGGGDDGSDYEQTPDYPEGHPQYVARYEKMAGKKKGGKKAVGGKKGAKKVAKAKKGAKPKKKAKKRLAASVETPPANLTEGKPEREEGFAALDEGYKRRRLTLTAGALTKK